MKFSEVTACAIALAALRQHDRPEAAPTVEGDPPPERDALRRFLLAQPPATVFVLAAVAYMGSPRSRPGHLADLLLRVGRAYPTRAVLADVLADWPLLSRYLTAGVRKLTAARVNLDKLHAG